MHIAVNALCITNRSGTGRYAWGLIHGLLRMREKDVFLSILIPRDFVLPEEWQKNETVRFYRIAASSVLKRIAWEQWVLPGLIRKIKPDLLHSPAFIAPVLRRAGCIQAVTVHDLAFLRYSETIPFLRGLYYRWAIPRSWSIADIVLTDSREIANELAGLPHAPGNIVPIHLGVDRKQFSSVREDGDAEILMEYGLGEPYLLFVGTREPRKNLRTILHAYQAARKKGVATPLVIAGRYGWMEKEYHAGTGVRWLGHVDGNHLPALYRGAKALIAPSLYEGFDLPPVESLACGTPVIASNIPVHREILGKSADYVPVYDVNAWANSFLAADKNRVFSMHKEIRSWENVAEETLDACRSVLCGQ